MSSTFKVILAFVAGVTLVCLCVAAGGIILTRATGVALSEVFDTNPVEVKAVGSEIADYEVPDGFGESFATSAADFSFISYTGTDERSHIYFFQLPSAVRLDQEELERQARRAGAQEKADLVDMKVVERKPGVICGQDVTLYVSEGVNRDGQAYRQVSGVFEGHGGQALVIYSAPTASWNQAVVDEFLASIH